MKFGDIPDSFTRLQKIIIETWLRERTVQRTAAALQYKSPSHVRKVVHMYRLAVFASGEALEHVREEVAVQ